MGSFMQCNKEGTKVIRKRKEKEKRGHDLLQIPGGHYLKGREIWQAL